MRYSMIGFIVLSGCALQEAQQGSSKFDVASREPVCARQCLDSYGVCVKGASGSRDHGEITVVNACNGASRQCLSTCPTK